MDAGIRALVASRVALGTSSRIPTSAAPRTAGILDGWWPAPTPTTDPWKNFPDHWGEGGVYSGRKIQIHESLTRSRERVYQAQPPLSGGDVARFDELWQGWMAFAWQHAPTDQAPQLLDAYGKKADEWRHFLDQRELVQHGGRVPLLPVLGGLAALGLIVYGIAKTT